MANSIELRKQYSTLLDQFLKCCPIVKLTFCCRVILFIDCKESKEGETYGT